MFNGKMFYPKTVQYNRAPTTFHKGRIHYVRLTEKQFHVYWTVKLFVSKLITLQVVALDADKNRPKNIIYSLTGQGVDSDNPINNKFEIGRNSGEIFVLKVMLFL